MSFIAALVSGGENAHASFAGIKIAWNTLKKNAGVTAVSFGRPR